MAIVTPGSSLLNAEREERQRCTKEAEVEEHAPSKVTFLVSVTLSKMVPSAVTLQHESQRADGNCEGKVPTEACRW